MAMQDYVTAIATFRQVLEGVTPEQIQSATPCASFDVGQLIDHTIDHTIGTQHMVTDALQDKPFNMTGVEVARSEQAAAFDRAAADAVAELRRDGAMDKAVTLPFAAKNPPPTGRSRPPQQEHLLQIDWQLFSDASSESDASTIRPPRPGRRSSRAAGTRVSRTIPQRQRGWRASAPSSTRCGRPGRTRRSPSRRSA
jgi:hypothetical protein